MSFVDRQNFVRTLYLAVLDRQPSDLELEKGADIMREDIGYGVLLEFLSQEKKLRMSAILSHIDVEHAGLGEEHSLQSQNSSVLQDRVLGFLSRLSPMKVIGYKKTRVGRDWDGGYVMIDDFEDLEAAYSLGIYNDVSWDLDIANRGIDVKQYDGTISGLPQHHPRFSWKGYNIGCETSTADNLISLRDAMKLDSGDSGGDFILKMDIEGAEWKILASIESDLICRFRQIVCELHDISAIEDEGSFESMNAAVKNLSRYHTVVHVHANNNSEVKILGGVPVPDVLELTLLRRDGKNFAESDCLFPTHLDRPCSPQKADLFLGQFRFL